MGYSPQPSGPRKEILALRPVPLTPSPSLAFYKKKTPLPPSSRLSHSQYHSITKETHPQTSVPSARVCKENSF